jgi:hypothetical protein
MGVIHLRQNLVGLSLHELENRNTRFSRLRTRELSTELPAVDYPASALGPGISFDIPV